MAEAVFLDRASLDLGDLDLASLEAALPGLTCFGQTTPPDTLDRVRNAEYAIVNKVVLDEAVLTRCPRLKLICVVATGTNNIDLDCAARLGITVVNCRGYGTDSLAQHVLTLILALSRRLIPYVRDVQAGAWGRSDIFCLLDYPIEELNGKLLGIVGQGELGSAVGRLGDALGMTVRFAERPGAGKVRAGRIRFEELLTAADVLSLHCPLTPETRGLIGPSELRAMKSSAILINTARGGVVDEPALAAALRRGDIAGAGVDVLTEEPPREGNPLLDPDIPNLLVTPHCAWGSRQARQRIVDQTVENIRAWRGGRALRVVSP